MKPKPSSPHMQCGAPDATLYRGLHLVPAAPAEVRGSRGSARAVTRRAALIAAGAAIVLLVLAA